MLKFLYKFRSSLITMTMNCEQTIKIKSWVICEPLQFQQIAITLNKFQHWLADCTNSAPNLICNSRTGTWKGCGVVVGRTWICDFRLETRDWLSQKFHLSLLANSNSPPALFLFSKKCFWKIFDHRHLRSSERTSSRKSFRCNERHLFHRLNKSIIGWSSSQLLMVRTSSLGHWK